MKWKIIQSCLKPPTRYLFGHDSNQSNQDFFGTHQFLPFDAKKHLCSSILSPAVLCEDEANPFEICATLKLQAAWNIQKMLESCESYILLRITTSQHISSFLELLDLWTAESLGNDHIMLFCLWQAAQFTHCIK